MRFDDISKWFRWVLEVLKHLWKKVSLSLGVKTGICSQQSGQPSALHWPNLQLTDFNEGANMTIVGDNLQAFDWGVPLSFAQPGSLRYGSSHRIMDWIEINTWEHGHQYHPYRMTPSDTYL